MKPDVLIAHERAASLVKTNRLIQDKETVFHFAALNERSADMFAIMEKYAANLDLIKQSNIQLQVSVFQFFKIFDLKFSDALSLLIVEPLALYQC